MTLFSRKKADRSLAEETALVPADDENSRQQDADKYMISGKKKCQEDSDSDEKNGKSKLSLHGLSSFAESGLNMSRIESRPLPETTFAYFFSADFEGTMDAAHLQRAMDAAKPYTQELRLLGVYPRGAKPVM